MNQNIKTKNDFLKFALAEGIHLGYKRWKTASLYTGKKNELSIFNLNLVITSISKVCRVFQQIAMNKKSIQLLIVNSNPEYNNLVQVFAQKTNQNYVNNRWIGGTLTNWEKISQGIFKFQELSNKFPAFSPKNPRYVKMKKSFNGISYYNQKPNILLVTNVTSQNKILREAHLLQIPVIAFVDSNTDQTLITYPIYGNANSFEYIRFCLDLFLKVYNQSK